MHSEEIQQMNSKIEKLEEEARSCENVQERNEKFDQIVNLEEDLKTLELQDLITGVKNFFKFN